MTEFERLTDIARRARLLLTTTSDPASRAALLDYAAECETKAAAIRRQGAVLYSAPPAA